MSQAELFQQTILRMADLELESIQYIRGLVDGLLLGDSLKKHDKPEESK